MGVPYNFVKELTEIKCLEDFPEGRCYVIQFLSIEREIVGHGVSEEITRIRQFVTADSRRWRDHLELLLTDPTHKDRGDFVAFVADRADFKITYEIAVEGVEK